jgi:Ca2+-binding RTX toxin-like protein
LKYLAYTLGDGAVSSQPTTSQPGTPTTPEKSSPILTSVSHVLASDQLDLTGTGSDSISLTGNALANLIKGNTGANKIKGLAGDDKLYGDAGNDKIYGGAGNDLLSGGAGKDAFVFDTKPNTTTNHDKVVDFKLKEDTIWLDNAVFTKLGTSGTAAHPAALNKAFLALGTKAKDANDYLIYDKGTGNLFYDADGSGHGAPVLVATFSKGLALTHWNFQVI